MTALDAHSHNADPKNMPMGLRDFAATMNTAGMKAQYAAKAEARELEALFRRALDSGRGEAGPDPDGGP